VREGSDQKEEERGERGEMRRRGEEWRRREGGKKEVIFCF
jgi:hypothetical protein